MALRYIDFTSIFHIFLISVFQITPTELLVTDNTDGFSFHLRVDYFF